MYRGRSRLSAQFVAALCLALAARETSGSESPLAGQSVTEKLRIVRDTVSLLQQSPKNEEFRVSQYYCYYGYWRKC
jgi:hypothetical protein